MSALATVIVSPLYPAILMAIAAEYLHLFLKTFSFKRYLRAHWLHGPVGLLAELFTASCRQLEAVLATLLLSFGLGLWRVPTVTFAPLVREGFPLPIYACMAMLFGACHLAALAWGNHDARIITCSGTLFSYLFFNAMFLLTGVAPLAGLVFGPLLLFSIAALASLGHGAKQLR